MAAGCQASAVWVVGFKGLMGFMVRSIPPTVKALRYGVNKRLIYLQESLVVPSARWGTDTSLYRFSLWLAYHSTWIEAWEV